MTDLFLFIRHESHTTQQLPGREAVVAIVLCNNHFGKDSRHAFDFVKACLVVNLVTYIRVSREINNLSSHSGSDDRGK